MFYLILSGAPLSLIIANFLAVITMFLIIMPLHSVSVAGSTCLLRAHTKMTFKKFKFNPFIHQGLLSIIALVFFNFAWATTSYTDTGALRKHKKQIILCPISAYAVHIIFIIISAIACTVLSKKAEVTYAAGSLGIASIGGSYSNTQNFLGMYFYSMMQINIITLIVNLLPLVPFDGYFFLRAFCSSSLRKKVRSLGDIVVFTLFVIFLTTLPQRFLFPHINNMCINIINTIPPFIQTFLKKIATIKVK